MDISKRLKNKLKHRNIDPSNHKRQTRRFHSCLYESYDSFKIEDLPDEGFFELEVVEEYGSYSAKLIHHVDRLETDEEFAERLCSEHDKKKKQEKLEELKEAAERKKYERLKRKFEQ